MNSPKLIFCILSLIFLLPLSAYAVKKIDANPINVAYILSQKTDPDAISSTLIYYGYTPQPKGNLTPDTSKPETFVYTHPNGSVIKYTFKDISESHPCPYIEVKSNKGSNETIKVLENLAFKKKGSGYLRNIGKHAKTETHCTHGSQGYLIFHRIKINPQE
ncbi:MAG: hypothetical protein K2G77_08940 [Muribaculaceae bacterium]|nr:hypothetical protein [Muribaculaceae bacterium]